ncbi:MAG TPA: universal stress protein [Acidimicrobiia bacterium]|nr:universal stress protein [Acidimicrobiia bacterium]
MREILLATDGSKHSLRAAETAGVISSALRARVNVINVVSDARVTAGPIDEYARAEQIAITQRDLLQSLGAEFVNESADIVRKAGGVVGSTRVLIGSPAREIVGYANDNDVDCIVMGRRGLGDAAGLLMGSVSHKVGHLTERTLITTE